MNYRTILCVILLGAIGSSVVAEPTITIELIKGTKEVPLRQDGKTYYQILQVPVTATTAQLAKAYATATKNRVKYAGLAFDVLANSNNRKKYDEALKSVDELIKEFESDI